MTAAASLGTASAQSPDDVYTGPMGGPASDRLSPPLTAQTGPNILFDNGPIINAPTGGFGGAPASLLQTSIGLNVLGFNGTSNASTTVNSFSLSDDFTVPNTVAGWVVDCAHLYAYQTGSTTVPTITNARARLWSGNPSTVGSVLILDTGNQAAGPLSTFSGTYRAGETTPLNNTRPIMDVVLPLGATFGLAPGSYFLEWSFTGSLAGAVFTPPRSITGTTVTGDGLQSTTLGATTTWAPVVSGAAPGFAQGLPFRLLGRALTQAELDAAGGYPLSPTAGVNLIVTGPDDIDIQLPPNGTGQVVVGLGADGVQDVCPGVEQELCPPGTFRLDLQEYVRNVAQYGAVLTTRRNGADAEVSVSGYNFSGGAAPFPLGGLVKIQLVLSDGKTVAYTVTNPVGGGSGGPVVVMPGIVCARNRGFDYLTNEKCFLLRFLNPAVPVTIPGVPVTWPNVVSIKICDCSVARPPVPNRAVLDWQNFITATPIRLKGMMAGVGGTFFHAKGGAMMQGTSTGMRAVGLTRPGAAMVTAAGPAGAMAMRWSAAPLLGAASGATMSWRSAGTSGGSPNANLWSLNLTKVSASNYAFTATTSLAAPQFRCEYFNGNTLVSTVNGPVSFPASAAPIGAATESASTLGVSVDFPAGTAVLLGGSPVIVNRVRVGLTSWSGAATRSSLRLLSSLDTLEVLTAGSAIVDGTGCAGSNGVRPTIELETAARLGGSYSVRIAQGRPSSAAIVFLTLNQPATMFGTCVVHVLNAPVSSVAITDAAGAATSTFAMPSSTQFLGTWLAHQAVVLDTGGELINLASATPGLKFPLVN